MINDDNKYGPVTSKELEKRADENVLQPWATKYSEAKRDFEELDCEETYRTCFRRDRDRILYSKAFRRLQYKTQVLVNSAGDHYRTRLTHTLEVQQLSTSIADALGANRDLAEAIALGHDLGHTPFGHAVETTLNKKLTDENQGGFCHAIQSVRYVEHLDKHKGAEGLNLCIQVREGILKHDTDMFKTDYNDNQNKQWDCRHLNPTKPGSIESQIAYWSDKIAYLTHDWDDFKNSKLYDEANYEGIEGIKELDELMKYLAGNEDFELRDLIRNIHKHLIDNTYENLNNNSINNSAKAISLTEKRMNDYKVNIENNDKDAFVNSLIVNFNNEYRKKILRARVLLGDIYAQSPTVARMDEKAELIISKIFDKYVNKTELLPWKTQNIIKENGNKYRVVADHIAGMTDRYAYKIYDELFLSGGRDLV